MYAHAIKLTCLNSPSPRLGRGKTWSKFLALTIHTGTSTWAEKRVVQVYDILQQAKLELLDTET